MTVGVAVKCEDGIVLASDSLSTFSRGAPVARHTNKVFEIEHDCLIYPVALIGAGMTAFIDKFVDRAKRHAIQETCAAINKEELDIVDFVEHVGETTVSVLLKEYAIDRNKFFGAPVSDFSLSLIVAGMTVDGDLRAYHIHSSGISESIGGYGTIGSGAAYAELFLHGFIPTPTEAKVKDVVRLACYAVKGAEIMDPHVGGDAKICTLKKNGKGLDVKILSKDDMPDGDQAKNKMEEVLSKIGDDMQEIVKPSKSGKGD